MSLVVKNPPANAEDAGVMGSIPGWEDPLEGEMATYSKHSCLQNLIDRGAWLATVHGVTKSLNRTEQKVL